MIPNTNYNNLKESYLFYHIAQKTKLYLEEHPEAHLYRMGIGDVSLPLCGEVIKALHKAVDDQGEKSRFHGYMPECGDPELRKIIAEYYKKRGVGLSQEEVFISSGASDELGDILDLFGRDKTVMIMEPAYPAYVDANIIAGNKIIHIPSGEKEGFLPLPNESVTADVIYICSPNNPTGAVFNYDKLKQWVDYANRTDAVLLFDAAYEAFIDAQHVPHSIFEIEGAKNCAIEICSLSKTAGFTGTRLGYTVIPGALKRNGMSLNEILMDALDQLGIWYCGGKNAPYIWMKCPNGMGSWEFFDYLLHEIQVVGTPGEGFGACGEGYFRFSTFGSPEDTKEAAGRLVKLLAR